MNLQPTLMGENVLIRPIRAEDWGEMFAVASDPEVWALHPVRDRYTAPAFRVFFDGALACGGGLTFVHRADGKIMGSSRYYNSAPERGEIEIGYTFLGRAYWGGAYNREIKRLMLAHILPHVETVVFWVGEKNWRSQRAMEKIGGVRRDGVFTRMNGNVESRNVVFEISRRDFSELGATP